MPHLFMPSLVSRTVLGTATNATTVGNTETSAELFNDRVSLIAGTTLLGAFHGITTTLYCMTTYALLKKLLRRNTRLTAKAEWRKTMFYIVYTSVLYVLVTLYTAGSSQNAIIAYVDNRLYPGGPYEYFVTYMTAQRVMVMTDIAALIIFWMTDALIIYRFVVFYRQVRYGRWIIVLPCAMYVGVAVLSALVLQEEVGLRKIFYLSENLMLAYYGLSLSLNVLCTLLIAARLYYHKVQLERTFGATTGSLYMNIATLLIESAALYATWSLLFLILCVLRSPVQILVLGSMSQIQVIAPLLIILWMARGKTWESVKSYGESSGGSESGTEDGVGIGMIGTGSGEKLPTPSSPSRIAQFGHGEPRVPGSLWAVNSEIRSSEKPPTPSAPSRIAREFGRVSGRFTRASGRFWAVPVNSGLPRANQHSSSIGEDDTKYDVVDLDGNGGRDVKLVGHGLWVPEPNILVDPSA